MAVCICWSGDADGRGFGGGGFGGGGIRGGGEFAGSHSFNSFSGDRGFGGTSSYDRSYSGSHGFSYNAQGERGAIDTPRGVAAGGNRDVTATGPDGRSFSSSRQGGAAVTPWGSAAGGSRDVNASGFDGRSFSSSREAGVAAGPYGRTVGGAERTTSASGAFGSWHGETGAVAGRGMSTDFGLAHYSSFNSVTTGHATAYWSHGAMTTQAGYVRSGFGYYNTFRPGWYTAHPGAWFAAGWEAGAAWNAAPWLALAPLVAVPEQPIYYDYGNTIVYQNDSVYQDGQDIATAAQYAQQATTLADQGRLDPPGEGRSC